MLDAFIIEEIRRREEAEKRKSEAPRLEMPVYDPTGYGSQDADYSRSKKEEEPKDRGVIVIDF